MTVDDCIANLQTPFKAIYSTSMEKQSKRVSKGKHRFSWSDFDLALRPIINQRVAENARAMPDKRRNLCRTFVCARNKDTSEQIRVRSYPGPQIDPFPHRIWVAMGATMSTELNFEHVYGEKASLAYFDNPDFNNTNPSLELLDEATTVFGDHRRVAALVSLGSGLSTVAFSENTPESNLTTGLPEPLLSKLRNQALAIEANVIKTRNKCDPGSFYRFDPSEILHSQIKDAGRWQETFAFEQVYRMGDVQDVTRMYVAQEVVGQQLKECANRLPKPRRTGSRHSSMMSSLSGSTSVSFDSLSISSKSESKIPPLPTE